ncbi:MAG TPA: hypothetical protein PLW54_07825, partial [Bacteroidia bacterium]|nr:hypothetical protein [Bacteroidia bacterium]
KKPAAKKPAAKKPAAKKPAAPKPAAKKPAAPKPVKSPEIPFEQPKVISMQEEIIEIRPLTEASDEDNGMEMSMDEDINMEDSGGMNDFDEDEDDF